MNVLWLDDEIHRDTYESYRSQIERECDCTVLAASNYHEAISILESTNVQIVIIDMLMPPPHGYVFAEIYQRLYPNNGTIICSGYLRNTVYRGEIDSLPEKRIEVAKEVYGYETIPDMKVLIEAIQYFKNNLPANMALKQLGKKDAPLEEVFKRWKWIYNAFELKPGVFGIKIDLKKLFSKQLF